ncbi:MAG TPA: ThiF family adenylyltransferase [Candidatus Nanoarchaeia archaeon]|nr:ThiF family adenylyltransferase [Candidatus Nanoarchaeia archaeon]
MDSKIRLKESLYLAKDSEGLYYAVFTATRKVQTWRVNSLTDQIISRLTSPLNYEEMFLALESRYGREEVTACMNSLVSNGLARVVYEKKDSDRMHKQKIYFQELANNPEEAKLMQEKIEKAKVGILGVGGIGSWVVNGLGQIGIGEIRVCDPDVVSITNLNRQLFYNSRDVGRRKVDVLKERLVDFNIIPYYHFVREGEDLSPMLNGLDFIVNCADSPSVAHTSEIVDKWARPRNIPYMIGGGYNMHLGMVGPIIIPGKSACFNCFLRRQKEKDQFKGMKIIKQVEDSGNLGPIAGTIGNMHVTEILKYFIGHPNLNINKFAEIDLLNMNLEWRTFDKRSDCEICGK